MGPYFLETRRLAFSTWADDDLPLALLLWGDSGVSAYISASGTFTREEIAARLRKELESQALHGVQYWPVFLKDTGELAGCCGLRPYDLDKGVYEMGVHLRSGFWGQGYATEAAKAVIDHAFQTLGARDLFAGHNPGNTASARLLSRLGFHYTHVEFYPPTGLYHPSYRYKMPD